MQPGVPEHLLLVAGSGSYPELLLDGARRAGVRRISLLAVRGMASRHLAAQADEVCWCGVGEYGRFLDWAQNCGAKHVAMAGQITPAALFRTRFDAAARELLRSLPVKNAHTVFGRTAELLAARGLQTLPSSMFMDDHLPPPGLLSRRPPDSREAGDIALGHRIGMAVCNLDVGQTVVVKDGMVLAVEAFEGTNEAIRRGGRLGGPGAVVVKVAKVGHDMRFDIPVIGAKTIPMLKRARISALAFQAGRTVLLEREEVIAAADRLGIALVALDSGLPPAPVRLENSTQKSEVRGQRSFDVLRFSEEQVRSVSCPP
ncbi:MAG: UDP-2,3-diacylglucosamine diphosphatase LpxI [bacterium]